MRTLNLRLACIRMGGEECGVQKMAAICRGMLLCCC